MVSVYTGLNFCVSGELNNASRGSRCVGRLKTNVQEQPGGSVREEPVANVVRGCARRTCASLNVNNDKVLGVSGCRSRKGRTVDEPGSGASSSYVVNETCVRVVSAGQCQVAGCDQGVNLLLQYVALVGSQRLSRRGARGGVVQLNHARSSRASSVYTDDRV